MNCELYIHIPFCVKKCDYCDFLSYGGCDYDSAIVESYFKALVSEIKNDSRLSKNCIIDSIFIGGGTPSAVPSHFICELMGVLFEQFEVSANAEISLEANPGTLTAAKLADYKKAGINRISLGVQSFNDEELQAVGRIHNAKIALYGVELIKAAGFENFSIDLMTNLPGQSRQSLMETLTMAVNSGAKHISCYELILEEGTLLYEKVKSGRVKLLDEEESAELWDAALSYLENAGFHRYEVSNFAREGCECRHNIGYWRRKYYRGYGMAAASFLPEGASDKGELRFTAETDIKAYIKDCRLPFADRKNALEYRRLSDEERYAEFMYLGLRMVKGVSGNEFYRCFKRDIREVFGEFLARNERYGFLEKYEGTAGDMVYSFTGRGMEVSNVLLSEIV